MTRIAALGLLAALASADLSPAEELPPAEALALVRADEARRVAVLAAAARTVVCIFADESGSGGGSGVLISPDGFGLTNFHVVAALLETRRGFGGLADGRLYPLHVLGIDPGGDIAMFKLEGRAQFDFAPLGDAEHLRVGQWVAALGNPFLLAEDYVPTATLGVVSGLHRYQYGQGNLLEYADCIQVSTSINPGNSGGPLFNLDGQVVGIVGRASFEERGRVNVGLGYAVTINQARRFLPGLRAGRLCEHGTLGATVRTAGDDLVFDAIQELSPAQRAGIELGDVLLRISGRPVRTPNEFNNAIAVLPADWPITLSLRRGGEEITVRARLERLPLRGLPAYVPDLERNLAEVRRILAESVDADRRTPGPWDRVSAEVRLRSAGQSWEQAQPRRLVLGAAAGNGPAGPDEEPYRSWQAVAGPLLGFRDLGPDWEVLGADEVDGRIAAVIERRRPEPRVRWKFDAESSLLLEATSGSAEDPEAIRWVPGSRRPFGQVNFPEMWTAIGHGDDRSELRIETLEAMPATQPAGRPGK